MGTAALSRVQSNTHYDLSQRPASGVVTVGIVGIMGTSPPPKFYACSGEVLFSPTEFTQNIFQKLLIILTAIGTNKCVYNNVCP